MGNCLIHPIPIYRCTVDKSAETYRFNYGERLLLTDYVWFIEGTKEKILVDAGGDADFSRNAGLALEVEDVQDVESGLSKLGMSPNDIDIILFTHLHYDHVIQASRFPKARLLIQRDELEFARNPHPVFAGGYVKQRFFRDLNFEVLDGDVEICDDVSVMKTPGHTPGGQSVVVSTHKGIGIIAGLCTSRESFEPPAPISAKVEVIIPCLHTNAWEAYDSLLRIKKTADYVLPLHETELPLELIQ